MDQIKQQEIDVAALKSQGLTRAQIAERLGLSERQVKSRIASAKRDPAIQKAMDHVGTGMEPSMVCDQLNTICQKGT